MGGTSEQPHEEVFGVEADTDDECQREATRVLVEDFGILVPKITEIIRQPW